jgi:DNA-directed RNA polymerase subunit RPC12/RpoP
MVAIAVGMIILVVTQFAAHGILAPVAATVCVTSALVVLVRWHASKTGYCCARCGREFQLTGWQDFLSPNLVDSKYARCPHCGQWGSHLALVRAGRA